MRTRCIIFLLVLAVFSPQAWSQTPSAVAVLNATFDSSGELLPSAQSQLGYANNQFQTLPDTIKAIFGNQRIVLDLTLNSGANEQLGIVFANNQLVSLTRYAPTDPTMRVTTNEATAMAIAQSDNISEAFMQAVNSGNLTYEGISGSGTLAVWITNIVVWITLVVNAFLHFLGMA